MMGVNPGSSSGFAGGEVEKNRGPGCLSRDLYYARLRSRPRRNVS